MRSFLLLPVSVRRGLAFVALVPMLASACAEGGDMENPPDGTGGHGGAGSGTGGHAGAGTGGAPSSSSSSGTGGAGGGCTDACTPGATMCSGSGVVTCAKAASGCTDWGSPVACDAGKTCAGGQCLALGGPSRIAVGNHHICAKLSGGGIKCWGVNGYGQLGLGDTNTRGDNPGEMGNNLPAVDLGAGPKAAAVDTRGQFTCALLEGGSVKCWGLNVNGYLGQGDTVHRGDGPGEMGDSLLAVNLGTGKTAAAISAGANHACALLDGGSVKCWGSNPQGQLGLGDTITRGDGSGEMGNSLPALNLGAGKTVLAISAGFRATCALLSDHSVKCWGYNTKGALGLGDTNHRGDGPSEMGDSLPAVDLGTGKTAVAISAGAEHVCALLNDGSVKCWGDNSLGGLGLGDMNPRGDGPDEMGDNLPAVNLGAGRTAVAISAGTGHSCALLDNGSVKCWGNNTWGQLGLGDSYDRGDHANEMGNNLPAVDLGAGKTAVAIAAGTDVTCAELSDGSIKCWGNNKDGQLGLGDTNHRGDTPDELGDKLPPLSL